MVRKCAAALLVLALASCYGRVSAWATAPGDDHGCCRGEASTPAETSSLAECCAVPAAIHAVKTAPSSLTFVVVPEPALVPAPSILTVAASGSAPPGPTQALRACVPSRAPPLV